MCAVKVQQVRITSCCCSVLQDKQILLSTSAKIETIMYKCSKNTNSHSHTKIILQKLYIVFICFLECSTVALTMSDRLEISGRANAKAVTFHVLFYIITHHCVDAVFQEGSPVISTKQVPTKRTMLSDANSFLIPSVFPYSLQNVERGRSQIYCYSTKNSCSVVFACL